MNKILVAVDISTPTITEKVCTTANDLALKYDAQIQLITILPDYGSPLVASFFPEGAQDSVKKEMREKLKDLASEYFQSNVKVAVIHSAGAKRANAILNTIKELKPDVVILGCRRKHSREGQRLLGSTTLSVTDRAPCTVMVVKQ